MNARKSRILIASPDRAFVDQVAEILKPEGYEVYGMHNGLQARNAIDGESFAAVVAYTKLASMSGLQVAKSASDSKTCSKSPIFVLADEADRETKARLAEIKQAKLLLMPVTPQQLGEALIASLKQPDHRDAYDARIINAFLDAFRETLEHYFGNPPKLGKFGVKAAQANTKVYLSAIISFTGEKVKGSLALSFDRAILIKLAGHIFANQKIQLDENILADMAGEMSNQVCGGVKSKFSKLGLRVMIGLPKVVVGEGHRVVHIVKNPVLWLPVEYAGDRCAIEFCMDRNNEPLPAEPAGQEDATGGDVMLF